MNIQADVSLYPLRARNVGEPIHAFAEDLRDNGLTVRVGVMSTALSGEVGKVFSAVGEAFAAAADANEVVLVLKASNACPTSKAEHV